MKVSGGQGAETKRDGWFQCTKVMGRVGAPPGGETRHDGRRGAGRGWYRVGVGGGGGGGWERLGSDGLPNVREKDYDIMVLRGPIFILSGRPEVDYLRPEVE